MGYTLHDKLVVAIASSALFDLTDSDKVFREQGERAYREFQRSNEMVTLKPGVAFPLVRRLLSLNSANGGDGRVVEVILVSRNDPDTGLRVMKSIATHELDISRAVFVSGKMPYKYLKPLGAVLFLSSNGEDVKQAIMRGAPAGQVFDTGFIDDALDTELRIAFDFDGILADDSAEAIFQSSGLEAFQAAQLADAAVPMPRGPLAPLFLKLAAIQQKERTKHDADPSYEPRLRIAIITARNAPAHERVVTTLRAWGVEVDESFFLGGIEKGGVLAEFRPHIFFDDTLSHVMGASPVVPSVYVPFGAHNTEEPAAAVVDEALIENARRDAHGMVEKNSAQPVLGKPWKT